MGVMTNPLMALMRKRAGGDAPPDPNALAGTYPDATQVDVGLQDPQALPQAPEQPSNGLNFSPDTDVLGPRLNPVKGLMQKLGFALGDAVRKQFGMPTDEELAQQDFENRLKVKQYKMQEQAAVSQEELRKEQIAQSRQKRQMVNIPGYGNAPMEDVPEIMHRLATEKQAELNYQRQVARDREADENADQRHRDYIQHEGRMEKEFGLREMRLMSMFREKANQKDDPNRQLSVMEAGQLGVPYGTRVGEVVGTGAIPTPAGVRSKFEDRAAAIDSATTLIDQADTELKAYSDASWTSPMRKGQSLMNARGNIAALPTLIGRLAGEVGNMSEGDRAAYTKLVSPPGGIATIAADPEMARNYLGIARKFIAARRAATSASQERMTGRPLAPPTGAPSALDNSGLPAPKSGRPRSRQ